MGKAVLTFIAAIAIGFIGFIIDVNINGVGNLGVVFAIATVGAFIVSAIKESRSK